MLNWKERLHIVLNNIDTACLLLMTSGCYTLLFSSVQSVIDQHLEVCVCFGSYGCKLYTKYKVSWLIKHTSSLNAACADWFFVCVCSNFILLLLTDLYHLQLCSMPKFSWHCIFSLNMWALQFIQWLMDWFCQVKSASTTSRALKMRYCIIFTVLDEIKSTEWAICIFVWGKVIDWVKIHIIRFFYILLQDISYQQPASDSLFDVLHYIITPSRER